MEIINYLRRNGSNHFVEHIGFHESNDYLLRQLFSKGNGYRLHKYEAEKDYHIVDKSVIEKLELQTCPERGGIGPWERAENLDYWQVRKGDRCCSFCGSFHPGDLLKLIEEKGFSVVENTTKSYKRYVNSPNGYHKFYVVHFSCEQIEEYNRLLDKYKVEGKESIRKQLESLMSEKTIPVYVPGIDINIWPGEKVHNEIKVNEDNSITEFEYVVREGLVKIIRFK